MGRGWAVGASTALAFCVAEMMLAARAAPAVADVDQPLHVLEALALVLALAAWSYAIGVAAYGSKGALVALAGYSLVACVGESALLLAPGQGAQARLLLVVAALGALAGLAATFGVLREVRARKGRVQWATATFFLLPLALAVAMVFAARSV